MEIHPLLLEIQKIFDLQETNLKVSEYAQQLTELEVIQYLKSECDELESALGGSNLTEVISELGDCIGNLVMLTLKMQGIAPISCDMLVRKFQHRKPWIFPDYQGKVPANAEEEMEYWNDAKKKRTGK